MGRSAVEGYNLRDFTILYEHEIQGQDKFTREAQANPAGNLITGPPNPRSIQFTLTILKVASTRADLELELERTLKPLTRELQAVSALIESLVAPTKNGREMTRVKATLDRLLRKTEEPAFKVMFRRSTKLLEKAFALAAKIRREDEFLDRGSGRVRDPDLSSGTVHNYFCYAMHTAHKAYNMRFNVRRLQMEIAVHQFTYYDKCLEEPRTRITQLSQPAYRFRQPQPKLDPCPVPVEVVSSCGPPSRHPRPGPTARKLSCSCIIQ